MFILAGVFTSLKWSAAFIAKRRQIYFNIMSAIKAYAVYGVVVKGRVAYLTFKRIY